MALFSLATLGTTLYAAGVPLLSPERLPDFDTGLLLRSLAGAGWLFTLVRPNPQRCRLHYLVTQYSFTSHCNLVCSMNIEQQDCALDAAGSA